jgi:hypothetical protein
MGKVSCLAADREVLGYGVRGRFGRLKRIVEKPLNELGRGHNLAGR